MAPLGDSRGVIEVGSLEELGPNDLRDVTTVVFGEKGAASHIEVICRIRGIKLVPASTAAATEPSPPRIARGLVPYFQASVSAASEFDGVDMALVTDVFVRMEHLLYQSVWEDGDLVMPTRRDELRRSILDQLEGICAAVPETVNVLVRGLDVRSDDLLLAGLRQEVREANPELGLHGASWLIANGTWVEFESELLRSLDRRSLTYGLPFVRGTTEFEQFRARFGAGLPEVIPFIETPASVVEFSNHSVAGLRRAAIGLKDLAQFYFAADRANPAVAPHFDFADPLLVDFVVEAVGALSSRGVVVSVYQQPELIPLYAARLASATWLPSVAIGALREIG